MRTGALPLELRRWPAVRLEWGDLPNRGRLPAASAGAAHAATRASSLPAAAATRTAAGHAAVALSATAGRVPEHVPVRARTVCLVGGDGGRTIARSVL